MPKKNEEDSSVPPVASESPKEIPSASDSHREPDLPFDLRSIDQKTLAKADAMLEGTGFSIQKLANWANSVEIRLIGIQETLPEQVQKGMMMFVEQQREKQLELARQNQAQGGYPMQGGGGMERMLLQQFLGGGGGEHSEVEKLLITLGKENLLTGREITREFLKRAMPDVLTRVDKEMKTKEETET